MNDNELKSPVRAKAAAMADGSPLCPICGATMIPAYRPFCSARCQDVDLHRWLSGGYAIPARPGDDDEAERPVSSPDDDG